MHSPIGGLLLHRAQNLQTLALLVVALRAISWFIVVSLAIVLIASLSANYCHQHASELRYSLAEPWTEIFSVA